MLINSLLSFRFMVVKDKLVAALGGIRWTGADSVQAWNAEVFCLLFSKKVRPAA